MKDDQACEVPFVEQLRSVPKDCKTVIAIQWSDDGTETGHRFIPVGFMMHRAADEIERLQAAQPEALEWIPLRERAPDGDDDVLVCHPAFRSHKTERGIAMRSAKVVRIWASPDDSSMIDAHWMPLPPLPMNLGAQSAALDGDKK